jgi:hypothetical protein
MKTELYEKVYIKTEEDLPKKDGIYWSQITEALQGSFHFNPDDKDDIDFFMGNVTFYLQPIPENESQVMPTDEEMKRAIHHLIVNYWNEEIKATEKIFKLFKSHLQTQSEITDEDIEKWAENEIANIKMMKGYNIYSQDKKEDLIFAAKAMRDKKIPHKF